MAHPYADSEPAAGDTHARPILRLGLIGSGIQASKAPALHEAEAAAQGIHCLYQLLDLDVLHLGVEQLPSLLEQAELRGFGGLNITHPCKQAVIPLLHELTPHAEAIGAVNTVHFCGGRRTGYNTDAWGFQESFRHDMQGASVAAVVQVGAGGAGAATAYALLELGARDLMIFDIDPSRAEGLATRLAERFPDREVRASRTLSDALADADGIVNATPVGMAKHPGSAVPADLLRRDMWVADIVYFPRDTPLLRAARLTGCRTLDGGGMAVYQAVRAFEIFTGRTADAERMRRHFERLSKG